MSRSRNKNQETNDVPSISVNDNDGILLPGEGNHVQERLDHETELKTRIEHCRRVQKICNWLLKQYPQYALNGGIIEITEEQKKDPKYYTYTNTHDLEYTGLNPKYILAFLGHHKHKENGKIVSHVQLGKFHDAILHGL